MKTTDQLINSLPWPDGKYRYAVVNVNPDNSFRIVYFDTEPHFHSAFHFWIHQNGARILAINAEKTTDWKSAIITHKQWLAAQPPAIQFPQVGETWMTSTGPVVIRHVENTEASWECCAVNSDGELRLCSLEQLKKMPSHTAMFVHSAMQIIDEHITPEDDLRLVAEAIVAGKLDAELAAMGYVKPEPAKAAS